MSGKRIIDGLKAAIAGDFSAVTIEGQRWVRVDSERPVDRINVNDHREAIHRIVDEGIAADLPTHMIVGQVLELLTGSDRSPQVTGGIIKGPSDDNQRSLVEMLTPDTGHPPSIPMKGTEA